MSQTETLLLVVLGFSLAALIALFIGRLLWAAALKLGARRMQKQVPSTLVGLQTERDRLRAEYAMLSQRLGTRLEATRLKMAEQMAEVSRHRNRLEALVAEKAASEGVIQGLQAEVAALTAQLENAHAVQAELQQAVNEKQQALDAALENVEQQRRRPHPASLGDSPLADSDPERRLRERIDKLNDMARNAAREREAPMFGVRALKARETPHENAESDPLLDERLAEAERETADLQKELEKLDAEWSKQPDDVKSSDPEEVSSSQEPRAVTNVISLAKRIRELKKGLSAS